MVPYNFEDDIKKKLEKRTINPTVNSWDKLAGSLESKKEKKGTKLWYFLGFAASIVGVLFMVSTFLKKDIDKTTPIIVDSPILENEDAIIVISSKTDSLELKSLNNIETNDATTNLIVDSANKTISKPTNHSEKVIETTKIPTIINSDKVAEISLGNSNKDTINTTFEDQKIEELITQIEALKTEYLSVSDSDIDALLKDAQNTLALEKLFEENTKTVDAYKLLQDVEADLDKSIRVKFLETLKLNFENIKTAIAQRND
jgi:hypothetical protein